MTISKISHEIRVLRKRGYRYPVPRLSSRVYTKGHVFAVDSYRNLHQLLVNGAPGQYGPRPGFIACASSLFINSTRAYALQGVPK